MRQFLPNLYQILGKCYTCTVYVYGFSKFYILYTYTAQKYLCMANAVRVHNIVVVEVTHSERIRDWDEQRGTRNMQAENRKMAQHR